jgi:flagellar biosynthesis protein FlhG
MNEAVPLFAAPASRPALRNFVAVASGKGGVGKTWFSIALAHSLAQTGQRVLLFDGDLGLANVDIQLGLTPAVDLGILIERGLPLKRGALAYAPGGFDVIAGRSGSGGLASITGTRLQRLTEGLAELADGYDRVILDLGAGIERTVRSLAACCRSCIVISTDEPTAITDAYAFIKLTLAESPAADLRIVINMAGTPAEGQRAYGTLRKACQTFLKFDPPLLGVVRRDPRVKDSIRAQTPVSIRHPDAPSVHDVAQLARKFAATP